jgi:hypothetical protein
MCDQNIAKTDRRGVMRDMILLCGAAFLGSMGGARAAHSTSPLRLPKRVLGIRFPDTELARAAAVCAYLQSPPFLFNHCMRTYVFAGQVAKWMGWKYDAELVFISSALHDLGFTKNFAGADQTFEQVGADFAKKFVIAGGFSDERAEKVWAGIKYHSSTGAKSRIHEIAMIMLGAGVDLFGDKRLKTIPRARIDAVLAEFPRAAFNKEFRKLIVAYGEKRPGRAGENDWLAPFVKAAHAKNIVSAFDMSPWAE